MDGWVGYLSGVYQHVGSRFTQTATPEAERPTRANLAARLYCFVKLIVPERTPEQLNDAYVPVIRLPLTVALMVYGHSVGMDGESVPLSDIPLAVPLKDPAVLNVESG